MHRGFGWIALVFVALASGQVSAADLHDPVGSFEGLLDLIKAHSNSWNDRLRGYATGIFWSLVMIQMVWKFGMLGLKSTNFNDFSAEFFRFTVVVGFFHTLLLYSATWSAAVIDSFRQAGAYAAGVGTTLLMPAQMFDLAIRLGKTVGDTHVGLDLATGIMVSVSAFIILMCFVFIAAFMQVTLIESYIVINASVFFMGFGGSEWTREYALAMWRYAVAVGAKLLVLTLIVGLIMDSAQSWQAAYNAQHDNASMWTMVGLAFVCAYLSKTIPDVIQGLITGVSVSGGSALGGMAATMTAAVAGGMALAAAKMGAVGGLGGGVADLLKSFSGGGSGGASGMNGSSFSGGGGGNNSSGSPGASSRTGGGGSPLAGSTGASAFNSSSAAATGAAAPASSPRAAGMAHSMADLAVRGMGAGVAFAVPGAEGAADVSLGDPPSSPADIPETPENVIRAADGGEQTKSMAEVKESLNRGRKA